MTKVMNNFLLENKCAFVKPLHEEIGPEAIIILFIFNLLTYYLAITHFPKIMPNTH